jgi:8-oxo-dGTP diphosphatase
MSAEPQTPLASAYPGLVKLGLVKLNGQERLLWSASPSANPHTHSSANVDELLALATSLTNSPTTKLTQVAVAILFKSDGAFLMTSRPKGKVYEGYWEFPGGKFEPNEGLGDALKRELHEELGIEILAFEPWCVECVLYPHALVELHFCRVTQWAGELQMREGQEYSWQTLPLALSPVLPGAYPVLDLLSRG